MPVLINFLQTLNGIALDRARGPEAGDKKGLECRGYLCYTDHM